MFAGGAGAAQRMRMCNSAFRVLTEDFQSDPSPPVPSRPPHPVTSAGGARLPREGGQAGAEVPTAQAGKWPHQQDTVPPHLHTAGWPQSQVPPTAPASPRKATSRSHSQVSLDERGVGGTWVYLWHSFGKDRGLATSRALDHGQRSQAGWLGQLVPVGAPTIWHCPHTKLLWYASTRPPKSLQTSCKL